MDTFVIPLKSWNALLALGLNVYQAYRAWQIITEANKGKCT
jgi:hypothetical protein